jgi:hypothetical protein
MAASRDAARSAETVVLFSLMELAESLVALFSELIYGLKSVGTAIKDRCAISNT